MGDTDEAPIPPDKPSETGGEKESSESKDE